MGSHLLHPTKANSSPSLGAESPLAYAVLILTIMPQFVESYLCQAVLVRSCQVP